MWGLWKEKRQKDIAVGMVETDGTGKWSPLNTIIRNQNLKKVRVT